MRDLLRSYMEDEQIACDIMQEKKFAAQIDELDTNGIDYSMPLSDFKRLTDIAPRQIPPLNIMLKRVKSLSQKEREGIGTNIFF